MNIHSIIADYQRAVQCELHLRNSANSEYDLQTYYLAATLTNKLINKMINHPDWTIELADKYYPTLPGEIPYPVSC